MEQAIQFLGVDQRMFSLRVIKRNENITSFDSDKIHASLKRAAQRRGIVIDTDLVLKEVIKNIYDHVPTVDVEKALIMAAVSLIECDTNYDELAAQLLMQKMYKELFGSSTVYEDIATKYRNVFIKSIYKGIELAIFDKRMLDFDLDILAQELCHERDALFTYLGLQTLYDRYLLKVDKKYYELPQTFWMRIAMGLAINEQDKERCAIKFYSVLSTLRYCPSTPTLFHAGFQRAQLSSCFLTTIKDDLGHIFKCLGDNAQLSKWAGGIGNDWTNIRATGAVIKSIHATSQGVLPFLKIANDVVAGITKSGIRRGGTVAYLETWHYDIDEFLDLRRNTGDERRRTHDMNTAHWIPDLFMKRVLNEEEWTLFSPDEVPDLHSLYGKNFELRYQEYERLADAGAMKLFKKVSASKLWRKMLSRLFETGHPWITFKDPCNVRSPQDHVGVVHSSNLCTEITLNTSDTETAVCNLGSVNLARHVEHGMLNTKLLGETIKVAIRMLDNVIDLNFYPTKEAENSNMRHRPIGLGQMGFQDVLCMLDIPFSSQGALEMADYIGEVVAYNAIVASAELAQEKGAYATFKGSKWDRGILPLDTLDLLEQERGVKINVSRSSYFDWISVREQIKAYGMRNSNVLAVAPTATISNITGCYPCIEPLYSNLYVKSNITGEFTIINKYLVQDLKKLNLWKKEMLELIKYYDGEITNIEVIPQHIREKYKGAFELDPIHLINVTAARGKWIDQSQSHNVFMKGVSGKKLNDIYIAAWNAGLKTTYYLRTLSATQIEKSTLDARFGFTQKREYEIKDEQSMQKVNGAVCDPNDTSCESCQ